MGVGGSVVQGGSGMGSSNIAQGSSNIAQGGSEDDIMV